jgi:uncharacterized membrane protein (UPF0127 family)
VTLGGRVLVALGLSVCAVACSAGASSTSSRSPVYRSSAPFGQTRFTVTHPATPVASAVSGAASGSGASGVSGVSSVSSAAGGASFDGCALLADTTVLQERGMMGRRDLGGYDAMVFQFASNTTVSFYNKNVPIPLSIAWFDSTGAYVGGAELAVCNDPCPIFSPGVPYRYGVEVPKGGLSPLGISAGAHLAVGGPCR